MTNVHNFPQETNSQELNFDQLKEQFTKNGLNYQLIDRNNLIAFFELTLPEGGRAGYEVCRISKNEASETTPSNEQFGRDGSKAFSPDEYERAKAYFNSFTEQLRTPGKIPDCSQSCTKFDYCSAPLCPADKESLRWGIWYCDEEICTAHAFAGLPWLKNQRKIARKCRDNGTYFNFEMLSHNCIISSAISGFDPDGDYTHKGAVETWKLKHPEKRELSDEEKEILRNRFISTMRGNTPNEKGQIP